MNGGFSGYTSCLRYFSSALGTNKIQSIVNQGPCTNLIGGSDTSNNVPPYISLSWNFAGSGDMNNP